MSKTKIRWTEHQCSVILEVLFSRTSGQRHRVLSLVGVAPRSSDQGFVNADRHLLLKGLAQ